MFIEPIDEAYFGKTPDMLELESLISKLRKKYTDKDNVKTIAKDDLVDKFINKIVSTFGFSKVYFGFDKTPVYNCYTLPIRESRYGDLSQKYTVTKNGIKYNDDVQAETLIMATQKLFFCPKITDGEVLATILHEIGHNFTDAVVPITLPFDVLKSSIKTFIIGLITSAKNKLNSLLPSATDVLDSISNMISTAPGFGDRMTKKNPESSRQFLTSVISTTNRRRYADERFADQFAAMYGYGAELSSVLAKIDYNKKNAKNSSVANFANYFYGLVDLSEDIMFSYTPMLSARLKSSVAVIEKELETNDDLPDDLRKDLQRQLKDIDLLALQYSSIDSNYSTAKKSYFAFLYKHMKNGDFYSKFITNAYGLDQADKNMEMNKK